MRVAALATFLLLSLPVCCPAQQVFDGDPVDPGTGLAYPMQPGLPLLLPGDDEEFGSNDDVLDQSRTGDIDLVVRSGSVAGPVIPAPARAAGGAPIVTVTAGGGSTGQGAEAAFTVLVSDGAPPYGTVLTGEDMDLRPATVYAFADLDGDGWIGPTNSDGSADNAFELEEASTFAGRQMGSLFEGRFEDSIGLEIAAPASVGALDIALVAGAWTGSDPEVLFTDGPFILTHWPFFPPLDPKRLLGGGAAPPPDPELPNDLEWDIERNYRPSPAHPTLGSAFTLSVNGSEATTDQLRVASAAASSLRVFAEPAAASYLARSRPRLRVAPAASGSGRALVLPLDRAVLESDAAASSLALRLLPVDLFANPADPALPIEATIVISGGAVLLSPDEDGDQRSEVVTVTDAVGLPLIVDDAGGGAAELRVLVGGRIVSALTLAAGAAADSDGDGVVDDGNHSGLSSDRPCGEGGASCDDNCPRVINPGQFDEDQNGLGDCCDGNCEHDPSGDGCGECAFPVDPTPSDGPLASAQLRLRKGTDTDKLVLKLSFELAPGATIAPDSETLLVNVLQSGSDGYSATLASLLTDLLRSSPAYRYIDRSGAVSGVTKLQLRRDTNGVWTMLLRAKGSGLAELAAGAASLELLLGDDVAAGALACEGAAPRLRCSLQP